MSTKSKHIPCLITIFGATGDLSHRKLFPSIFHLFQQDNLDEHIAIIGIGRRDYSNDEFRNQVKSSIQKHVEDTNRIDEFMNHVFYHKTDVSDEESYDSLLKFSNQLDSEFDYKAIACSI